ncbi:hypothetical protein SUGI_1101360 [Cryptomeria japonica]|nr:hypothetical protein SUGI_1101360 [Cryptomeria japonica]
MRLGKEYGMKHTNRMLPHMMSVSSMKKKQVKGRRKMNKSTRFGRKKKTIDNRDEHAMTKMKLQIAHKFHNLQGILTHTTDLAALTFIDKHLEDLSNKVKSRHISSQLGLDHPSAHPFHPVQDGFGHTDHCQRDLIECMNMRRRPSISNRTPSFPPMPGNHKRQNWFNDLDREDE